MYIICIKSRSCCLCASSLSGQLFCLHMKEQIMTLTHADLNSIVFSCCECGTNISQESKNICGRWEKKELNKMTAHGLRIFRKRKSDVLVQTLGDFCHFQIRIASFDRRQLNKSEAMLHYSQNELVWAAFQVKKTTATILMTGITLLNGIHVLGTRNSLWRRSSGRARLLHLPKNVLVHIQQRIK